MDRETQEKKTSIGFRCRKILPGEEKCANECLEIIKNIESSIVDDGENCISSPTPEKPDRKLTMKEKQRDCSSSQHILSETPSAEVALKFAELPDKFKALADLFDRMGTSIRLLGLRRRLTIFKNIRTQVELLSKREFTYSHLAQMKYVFPDAIQLEKVLIHDEKSLCMMPDLKVKLLFDVVGSPSCPGQSTSKFLCETFRLRLLQLFQFNHANDAEIPEAMLPEPFDHRSNDEYFDSLSEELFDEIRQQTSVELDSFSSMSHFSSSFRQHFCHKVIVPKAEQTKIIASTSPSAIVHHGESKTRKNLCTILDKDSITSLPTCSSISGAVCTPIHDPFEKTPAKGASSSHEPLAELTYSPTTCVVSRSCESSPLNLVKVGGDFMAETPALQTPKRPMPIATKISVNTIEKSAHEPKTNPSARRTLVYSPMKMDSSKSKLDFDAVEGTNIDEHSSIDNHSSKKKLMWNRHQYDL
ncbi:hypothetical protein HPP92_020716 [Vanilla planifolia]|uniref:CDT1 Geminin-binding domain-containing protein n=1 Tax=Vanilla planifolia TaxID=51239 RepID=A0A835UEV3_VANPL|nr:hypothetical protein HPP92_020716 [Vanilla planifolia]